jgi:hypothetical protein
MQLAKQAVAGMVTTVTYSANDNHKPEAQSVEDKRTPEQKSAAQARA